MSSVQTERRFTEQREIPIRRVMLTDPAQIPRDFSTTPSGTIYCTTPGGTRIVYDRSLLMKLKASPLARSPPKNLKAMNGVTAEHLPVIPQENLPAHPQKESEELFEMEF